MDYFTSPEALIATADEQENLAQMTIKLMYLPKMVWLNHLTFPKLLNDKQSTSVKGDFNIFEA